MESDQEDTNKNGGNNQNVRYMWETDDVARRVAVDDLLDSMKYRGKYKLTDPHHDKYKLADLLEAEDEVRFDSQLAT